jgi:hypothetical protein
MRVVNGYFLSSLAHPSGELIGPRALLAPNAGVDDWLAGPAEAVCELLPPELSVCGFVVAVAKVGDGE